MKTIFWTIALATVILLNGCAILDYAKERKVTICSGITEGKCQEPFKELDASKLPYVGNTISPVTDRLLTCANYDKEDIDCPEGSKKIVIDLIK